MTPRFESDYVPVIALKELVVFPGAVAPLELALDSPLRALEESLKRDKRVFLVCQHDPGTENPGPDGLHAVGTVADVIQVIQLPDASSKVLVQGVWAARAIEVTERGNMLEAFVVVNQVTAMEGEAASAHRRSALESFERYAELSGRIPDDLLSSVRRLSDPQELVYAVANHVALRIDEKQEILESNSLEEKFLLLNQFLEAENQILEIENKIEGEVRTQIGRSQREAWLNEQLRVIERELGVNGDEDTEMRDLRAAVEDAGLPDEAKAKADRELSRLNRMPPMSPEAAVSRTWLEWITELPWIAEDESRIDLEAAREHLDRDHYGLNEIKERVLEYLAVLQHAQSGRGPILCFVGPPGVGKTSLGASIAECMGRRFVRISLGGVRDEAEIRGHRRTYVGALPGKIIQAMRRAGIVNPVILLDEIDKMSSDFRGDPASALLEVLDPEQNAAFADHYLEVDYDLSNVVFLTTANTSDGIPWPLLDRMEMIRLSGYSEEEKLHIATKHLLPRQRKEHGLRAKDVKISKAVMRHVIADYTREAGVRNLERSLARICRKVTRRLVENPRRRSIAITLETLPDLLGPPRYTADAPMRKPEVGITTGLAWTETGGELLPVEVTLMKGKGDLQLTGKLGEVMQESARAALSWVRSHAADLGLAADFHAQTDIHIHVPEGAIPKDGPSAGVTIATSLASALTGLPVRQDVCMTGEITLRGRVLRVGGLKEKALAARRRGITRIIIPKSCQPDLQDLPEEARKGLEFIPVEWLTDVLDLALVGLKKQARPAGRAKESSRRRQASSPRSHARAKEVNE